MLPAIAPAMSAPNTRKSSALVVSSVVNTLLKSTARYHSQSVQKFVNSPNVTSTTPITTSVGSSTRPRRRVPAGRRIGCAGSGIWKVTANTSKRGECRNREAAAPEAPSSLATYLGPVQVPRLAGGLAVRKDAPP